MELRLPSTHGNPPPKPEAGPAPGADPSEPDRRGAGAPYRRDRAAFEALFRAHSAALCAFAWGYVRSPEVAEGIVQDVFLRLWKGRTSWDPACGVRAYLYAAVRNGALDHLKHRRVVERWAAEPRPPSPAEPTPEEELQHKELEAAVQAATARLPERCRLVFTLSRQHGLTYAEIADVLGISPKTVEAQMRRAFGLTSSSSASPRRTSSPPKHGTCWAATQKRPST